MNKELRKKWNRQLTFLWKLLNGSALRSVNFNELHTDAEYKKLHATFFYGFKSYKPQEWEPLHSFYRNQNLPLPSSQILQRQAAELAAEFVFILDKVYKHELPPSYLAPLVVSEEIEIYVELTHRYLDAVRQYEIWPLAYFYGVAAQVLKIKNATSNVPLVQEESLPAKHLQPVGV